MGMWCSGVRTPVLEQYMALVTEYHEGEERGAVPGVARDDVKVVEHVLVHEVALIEEAAGAELPPVGGCSRRTQAKRGRG